MTLYLWIAAYIACAVLIYGLICGLDWSEFGAALGWGGDMTWLAMTGAAIPPIGLIVIAVWLIRADWQASDRLPFRLRWYFRSRKPASRKSVFDPGSGDWTAFMAIHRAKAAIQLAESHAAMERELYRAYGPKEGTVAHKMRSLSEDAEKLRAEERAVKLRRFKLDALSWAVDKISHTAKEGLRDAVFTDDPGDPESWAGCKAVSGALPGSYFMRSEVLPFLNDSLSGMGFRCDAVWGGKGSLYGITHITVEW